MSSRNGLSVEVALDIYFWWLPGDPEDSDAIPKVTDSEPWEAYFPPQYLSYLV